MFYSINSPITALSGLELASHLIKEAAIKLSKDFPSITTFSTLSPIPLFMQWLQKQSANPFVELDIDLKDMKERLKPTFPSNQQELTNHDIIQWLFNALTSSSHLVGEGLTSSNSTINATLVKDLSLRICAYYLVKVKQKSGKHIFKLSKSFT